MKYVLGLGITALVIIAFAFFWLLSGSDLQNAQEEMAESVAQLETQSTSSSQQVEANGFGTMNDLLSREENLECQITTINNDTVSEGTFFVADSKIRGDFITKLPDMQGTGVSSLIIISDTMYVWTEINEESYGVKTNLGATADTAVPTQEPVSLDERVKYSCQKWEQVDQSVFIPPSDVLFQDVSKIMEGGMEYGTVYEEGELPY